MRNNAVKLSRPSRRFTCCLARISKLESRSKVSRCDVLFINKATRVDSVVGGLLSWKCVK